MPAAPRLPLPLSARRNAPPLGPRACREIAAETPTPRAHLWPAAPVLPRWRWSTAAGARARVYWEREALTSGGAGEAPEAQEELGTQAIPPPRRMVSSGWPPGGSNPHPHPDPGSSHAPQPLLSRGIRLVAVLLPPPKRP